MKKYRMTPKFHAKFVATFTGLAVVFLMVFLSIQPYKWINPETDLQKLISVFICLVTFCLLACVMVGIWVDDLEQLVDKKKSDESCEGK